MRISNVDYLIGILKRYICLTRLTCVQNTVLIFGIESTRLEINNVIDSFHVMFELVIFRGGIFELE